MMQIKNFSKINESGASVSVKLGTESFLDVNGRHYLEVVNSTTQGIQWQSCGETVTIIEQGRIIRGLPDFLYSKVIAIQLNPTSRQENSLLVYNNFGKLTNTIRLPKLTSNLALEDRPGNEESKYFDDVRWYTNDQGKKVFGVKVNFGWYLFEMRVFDTETLEFGACLYASRD